MSDCGRRGGGRGALVALAALAALAACTQPEPAATASLRVGIAAFDRVDPLASREQLGELGYDYIEPALSKLAALSDEALAAARAQMDGGGLRVETVNWFLPGDLKVTGPAIDEPRVTAYLERALAIAESFGAKVIVFGSPAARSYPDGFPRERAWQQLVGFLRQCAAVIERNRYGMVVGIEPLRKPESNLVNTVGEAVELARAVDRPQVKIIVDFYHLTFEGEDPGVVRAAAPWIVHLQIADPRARGFPRSEVGEPRYAQWFAALRAGGYRGRISIEAIAGDLASEAAAGLAFLRRMTTAR